MTESCVVLAHMAYIYKDSLHGESPTSVGAAPSPSARGVETVLASTIYLTHNYGFDLEAGYGGAEPEDKKKKKQKKGRRDETAADTSLRFRPCIMGSFSVLTPS